MKWKTKPGKYENARQMQKIIDKYFEECEESGEIPTVTGLGFVLDMNRQDLLNYENCLENGRLKSLDDSAKREIVDTIKRAKKYIESKYENALFTNGKTVGAIFTLKNNYHWVDKQEIEQTNRTISIDIEEE